MVSSRSADPRDVARRKPLRVLIVEDSEEDAELVLRELRREGYEPVHERVVTAAEMRTALETKTWDVVLSDYSLPQWGAREALAMVRAMNIDVPFLIISGTVGEEIAVEAIRAGAQDFMLKDNLARMGAAIEREVREAETRRERVTEGKRTETEREGLLRELQQAVETRDAFLAIASHELRTPLTSLKLTVQTLQRSDRRGTLSEIPGATLSSSIDLIARQVTRLGSLVENLLDVAHITSNRMSISRESVDLRDVVTKVIAQQREVAPYARSEVVIDAHEAVGEWDRLRIETVVANLISNAMKFGDGKPIDVSVSRDGPIARLALKDRGIGITPEQQARIFEKFERAVPDQHYGGFGLGLWIVRQIVAAHGGTVHVMSAPGAGSTFVVELPLLPPKPPAE